MAAFLLQEDFQQDQVVGSFPMVSFWGVKRSIFTGLLLLVLGSVHLKINVEDNFMKVWFR